MADRATISRGNNSGGVASSDQGGIESFLTYKVSILRKKLDHRTMFLLSQHSGLKLTQWRVLGNLCAGTPTSVREMAQRVQTDKSQVSRALAQLGIRKLVRKMPDPADARSVLFEITPSGEALQTTVMEERRREHARLMSIFTQEEQDIVMQALDRLEAWLDRESVSLELDTE